MPGKKEKLTGEGLEELCNNTMQLVTDNKVNMKNCFDVELIEHIGELMKQYESDGEMNFHRAAGTLDASARIYAYRVDQVHNDVFKVKGSITQLGEDDQANGGSTNVRRAKTGAKTLEEERNITLTNVDQEDKVDGYFKQMARKLENGGSKALLLNILPYGPDGVIFDGMQCVQAVKDTKMTCDGAAPSEIPPLDGRIAPTLGHLLPAELFLDSVNMSADDEAESEDSVHAESPAPEAPLSPVKSMADEDDGLDQRSQAQDFPEGDADLGADLGMEAADHPDDLGLEGFNDEVDFLLEHVCVDSDFAFFDDNWQTRRKAKKAEKEKAEKEKAEKKEKVSFDITAAFGDKMDEDIHIDVESADKHTQKRKRATKKPVLWDALTTSTWPANPDSFFRLDWLDRLLPPKSKTGNLDANAPGPSAALDDDGAFCDDGAFAEVLDEPMFAENELPPEEPVDLCVAPDVTLAPAVPGNVNVGRVKQGMRTALEAMLAPCDEPARKRKKGDAEDSGEAIPQTTFTELMETVRLEMPKAEQSSLTVAIAFICTLHMCNENNLELGRSELADFGDFNITRPNPPPQIAALAC